MRLFFFMFFFLLCTTVGTAQRGQIPTDSLLKVLPKTIEDTNKVNILNALSYAIANTNPEQSRDYATQAITLAKKLNYKHGYASGTDMVGTYYERLGDYAQALEYKLEALHIHEQISDMGGISRGLNNIGVIYYRQKNYDRSLEYYGKALVITQRQGSSDRIAVTLLNIGEVYLEKSDYAKAIEYEAKSIEISKNMANMEDCIAFSLGIIGQCYSAQGKYEKALENIKQTISIFTKLNDKISLMEYLVEIGNVYVQLKRYEEAKQSFYQAIQLNKEIGSHNDGLKDAYLGLAQTYAAEKNFEKSYSYQNQYDSIKDILFNENNAKRIEQMQTLYEVEKKQAEIEILKKDKVIQEEENRITKLVNYLFLGTFLFITTLTFVLYRNNRNKQKANQLLTFKNNEIELKNLEIAAQRDQILETQGSLALANEELKALNTNLEDRVQERTAALLKANEEIKESLFKGQAIERKRVAVELHDNLGALLSALKLNVEAINEENLNEKEKQIYHNVRQMMDNAVAEVRFISHNLLPLTLEKEGLLIALQNLVNKLSLSGKIHFELDVFGLEQRLEKEIEFNLYSICLELTNNILKHSKATQATIQLINQGNYLSLLVGDNGMGIQADTDKGMGLKNIQERLENMNAAWHIDSSEQAGTSINIEIPLQNF